MIMEEYEESDVIIIFKAKDEKTKKKSFICDKCEDELILTNVGYGDTVGVEEPCEHCLTKAQQKIVKPLIIQIGYGAKPQPKLDRKKLGL